MRFLFFLFLNLCIVSGINGQHLDCSSDQKHALSLQNNAFLKADRDSIEKDIIKSYNTHTLSPNDTLITVPIVVHIIHKGEDYGVGSNLSDEKIKQAISGINNRFNGSFGFGVNTKIQFCLAKRDPNNNFTTGINRVDGTTVANYDSFGVNWYANDPGADEKAIKDLSKWPVKDYYNLWIVWNIYGPTGYANYPGSTINAYDGSVITAGGFTYNNSISSHEIGHGFNLYHVWGTAYTSCQNSTNCSTTDDRVCDTPPHVDLGNGECTVVYPCPSKYPWDNTRKNIMGKCGAQNRFTQGQKDRIRASFPATVRKFLLTSKGCLPAHNNDVELTKAIFCDSTSYVVIKNNGANTLDSITINWSINNTSTFIKKWKGSLKSLDYDTFVFVKNLLSPNQAIDLKIWSTSPNGKSDTINFNDTIFYNSRFKSLIAGNYTIGGSNPDFNTIKDAASALNTKGICGPVIFSIRNGTYTGNIELTDIIGSSAKNTILFKSSTRNSKNVIIQYAANNNLDNFVLKLNGTKYISFENISMEATGGKTYSMVIDIQNGANNNHFSNCIFTGKSNSWSSSVSNAIIFSKNTDDWANSFTNNTFKDGAFGIYFIGDGNYEDGNVISNNKFINQTSNALYLGNQEETQIINNAITTIYKAQYGIRVKSSIKNLKIYGNRITGLWRYTIYIQNYESDESRVGIIANNFLHAENSIYDAVIYLRDCSFIDIYHNSLSQHNNDTNSKSFYCYRSHNLNIKNNIFANFGKGYSLYFERTDLNSINCNYNNLYTKGVSLIYNNKKINTLNDWQKTTLDKNSYSLDPLYKSDSVLYACATQINNKGVFLPEVRIDIDSIARSSSNPDIGAAEFENSKLSLGQDITACDSIILKGNLSGGKYGWNTMDSTREIKVNKSGIYWVENTNSCNTQKDTIEVQIITLPVPVLPKDSIVCDSIVLDAKNNFSSYLWNTQDSTQKITADANGIYSVEISNICGSILDSTDINIITKPRFNLGKDTAVCDQITLKASNNSGNYKWSNGDTTKSIKVFKSGTYFLESKNKCGSFKDTISIQILANPSVKLGKDTSNCKQFYLIPNNLNYTYQWNNSKLTNKLLVTQSGKYWAQVTDTNGCKDNSDTIEITILPLPIVDLGGDTFNCDFYTLNPLKPEFNYKWSTGDTQDILKVTKTGIYFAKVKNEHNCEITTLPIRVTIHPLPIVNLGSDTAIFKTETLLLDAGYGFSSYLWHDLSANRTILVKGLDLDSSHNYYVKVIDKESCENSDTIKVSLKKNISIKNIPEEIPVNIYPNPSNGLLFVEVTKDYINTNLYVYNTLGETIKWVPIQKELNKIDMTNLPKGIYYLVLINQKLEPILNQSIILD